MADGGIQGMHWYVPAQLAGVAGLPTTERGVHKQAEREGWMKRRRLRGKGWEYAFDSLPQQARDDIGRRAALSKTQALASDAFAQGNQLSRKLAIAAKVDGAVQKRTRETGLASAAALTGKSRERMDAKLALLALLATFAHNRQLGICAAMAEFCDAYNSGELTVPITVRMHTGAALAPRTLRRWRHLNKTQGPAALAGGYGNRAGTGVLDTAPQLHDFTIGLIADKPHISAKLVFEALQARFAERDDLPKLRTVQDWLARWKRDNAEVLLAVANPDAWKNRYMSGFGSLSESVTRACQLWMLDSTPADLQLVDGRYNLVGVIDVAWRGFRLHVCKTSSAEAVTQVMRRAIIEWGVPEAIKVDNGRDYASQRVGSMLTALHIDARFSAPFSPWEKGNIERAFRTFSHSLLELLPGYSGHNVAEAQALRAGKSFAERLFKKNEVIELKLTAAELQAFCDDWCRHYYEHEKHEGLGCTPFERYAQLRDVVNRIGDVRALDLLLGGGAMRRVTKKGLRIDNLVYIAPELASVVGQDVLVRQDDGDLGRIVVYHGEQFLCIAECPEVAGVSRREIAIEGKARQAAAMQQKKRELKALGRKANTADLARDILDHKARQNASLGTLPAPNVVHLTPAIEAAGDAADALEQYEAGTQAPPAEPVTLDHLANLRDAMRGEQAQDETAEDRFRRALRSLMKPEGERDDIERRFLRNHLTSAEFLGRWTMFEDFGPSAFGLPDEFAALLPDGAAFDRLSRAQQGEP
ncbi:DNA-binding protein [Luteimonas soli]|uniref:DNA-binding protein n=1 Tax=Luteimonas soli TaxID=1648966 RepID=A0ABV7XPC3_9GAMM